MSALTCPVCTGAMREVSRNNVTIDTCTQCRGVWLDRGELDKLLGDMRSGDDSDRHPRPHHDARYHDDDDDDHRRPRSDSHNATHGDGHGYPRKKRSKMESFMEIFD